MRINEHLKFSWGHIIAFVAMIFIGYISFLGLSYLTNGEFMATGMGVLVIVVAIFALFMGIQVLKASDHHFKRRIHIERALLFASPLLFAVLLFPFFHFWRVFDNRDTIESDFSETITNARSLFDKYEDYSNARIAKLETLNNKALTPIRKANALEALNVQLLGTNYVSMRDASYKWIDNASEATVWNVFMIGNIETITDAFTAWNKSLVDFSKKVLKEEVNVKPFDEGGKNVNEISRGFISIKSIYSKFEYIPNWYSWIWLLGLYICLMLPYMIQDRHTKSTQHVVNRKTERNSSRPLNEEKVYIEDEPKTKVEDEYEDTGEIVEARPKRENKRPVLTNSTLEEDDDEYGSFTM